MTIADDMRNAADKINTTWPQTRELATRLRAHADTIERVIERLRTDGCTWTQAEEYANALCGDKP